MKHERRPGEDGVVISELGKFQQVQKTANRRSVQARWSPPIPRLAPKETKVLGT